MAHMPTYVQPPLPEGVDVAIEAFGNRVRIAILAHLVTIQEGQTSGEIADALGLTLRPVQRHLWAMEELGLVVVDQPDGDRRGKRPRYSINSGRIRDLYKDLGRHLRVE